MKLIGKEFLRNEVKVALEAWLNLRSQGTPDAVAPRLVE